MTSPNLRSICWLCYFKCAYACFCIHTYVMPTLEVRPAYTVKEVSTASTMLILFSAYAWLYYLRSLNCFYYVKCLVVVPAYIVKEVWTASTMLILFSAYTCLNCQRSINCFYNDYTSQCLYLHILSKKSELRLQCLYCLVLMPAYTVNEVSTASIMLIRSVKEVSSQDSSCFYCFCNLVTRRF